ncbi:MAG: hypothetical protein GYB32_02865 [Algicola sp.]|nr:hypothetical protein [Algicola sp.]
MNQPLFTCEVEFSPSPHLYQIYDGFTKLKQQGIITLKSKPVVLNDSKPVIKVVVNNKHTLIYDTLDGLNWMHGTLEANLEYFKNHFHADFYFKRSYSKMLKAFSSNKHIYPLGLNYSFDYSGNYPLPLKDQLKSFIRKHIKKNVFKPSVFEFGPRINSTNKVLFLCRLWNPNDVVSEQLKSQRAKINSDRMAFVRACQKEFGKNFTGGIQIDDYSNVVAKDVLVPHSITNKKSFLQAIKDHNVCVATTGLHDSIGWKFAEYVAASRAIVSEPLMYELPGEFKTASNFLDFSNTEELIENIVRLFENKDLMQSMMHQNHQYYQQYVASDKMILNTLLKTQNNS